MGKFVLVLLVVVGGLWFAIGGFGSGQSQNQPNALPSATSASPPEPVEPASQAITLIVEDTPYELESGEDALIRVPNDSHRVHVYAALAGSGAQLWTPHSTRQYVPNQGIGTIACTGKRIQTVDVNGVPSARSADCPVTFQVRVQLPQ